MRVFEGTAVSGVVFRHPLRLEAVKQLVSDLNRLALQNHLPPLRQIEFDHVEGLATYIITPYTVDNHANDIILDYSLHDALGAVPGQGITPLAAVEHIAFHELRHVIQDLGYAGKQLLPQSPGARSSIREDDADEFALRHSGYSRAEVRAFLSLD